MLCVQDSVRRVLRHTDPDLLHQAEYVTIVFEDQKEEDGCPHPTAIRAQIPLPYCAGDLPFGGSSTIPVGTSRQRYALSHRGDPREMVTPLSENCSDTLLYIRGFKTFGFHPHEIGNKSIRSDHNGSLSHGPLLQNYDPWPLVLGCISGLHSTPVLEWTNNMSCDMIHLDSFFDAPHRDLVAR
jgi:hypothetical protein